MTLKAVKGGWVAVRKETVVHHWRYEDGWQDIPAFLCKDGKPTREFREEIVGWHCWVYPVDDHDFIYWMYKHCPTADCTHRFNSGDPMYTVHIRDQHEMLVFKLMFP